MKKAKRNDTLTRKPTFRGGVPAALARAVWKSSKDYELSYEDVIGCCAILVASVAKNTGEPVEYLLGEVNRRMPPGD